MGSPLNQIVQQAQTELGLPVSQYVIRAPDNTARQMGALATRLGQFLVRRHDWSFLRAGWAPVMPPPVLAEGTLTAGSTTITDLTVANTLPALLPMFFGGTGFPDLLPQLMVVTGTGITTSTRLVSVNPPAGTAVIGQPATTSIRTQLTFSQDTLPFPADWARAVARTQWDRTMRWELRGAETPQQSQWLRSGIVATGPRRHFEEISGGYRIWPPGGPTDTPAQLFSEYIRKTWSLSAAGVAQDRFLADGDTCVFDDDLMTTGLELFFWKQKGFDASHLQSAFEQVLAMTMASDGGSQTLDMTRSGWPVLISAANVQDTGFGNP